MAKVKIFVERMNWPMTRTGTKTTTTRRRTSFSSPFRLEIRGGPGGLDVMSEFSFWGDLKTTFLLIFFLMRDGLDWGF